MVSHAFHSNSSNASASRTVPEQWVTVEEVFDWFVPLPGYPVPRRPKARRSKHGPTSTRILRFEVVVSATEEEQASALFHSAARGSRVVVLPNRASSLPWSDSGTGYPTLSGVFVFANQVRLYPRDGTEPEPWRRPSTMVAYGARAFAEMARAVARHRIPGRLFECNPMKALIKEIDRG